MTRCLSHHTELQTKHQACREVTKFSNDLKTLIETIQADPTPEILLKTELYQQEYTRLKNSIHLHHSTANPLIVPEYEDWLTDFTALEGTLQTIKDNKDKNKWLHNEEAKRTIKSHPFSTG